jgi:nitroreductase
VRGFTDRPVPVEVLGRVVSAAAWAPSGSNRLAVKIGDAKKHLRLQIDNCDNTGVRGQQPFFTAFRTSIILSHVSLLLLKLVSFDFQFFAKWGRSAKGEIKYDK